MMAGREWVLRYNAIKTAPTADAAMIFGSPPLQWMSPKAIAEMPITTQARLVYRERKIRR